jgi:ribosomal protein L27
VLKELVDAELSTPVGVAGDKYSLGVREADGEAVRPGVIMIIQK